MLLNIALNWLRHHWRPLVTVQALLFLAIWFGLHPHDHELIAQVRAQPLGLAPARTLLVAGWISRYGDFPWFNVLLALGLWLAGYGCRRPKWQRLALMIFLCAGMAGISTDILRAGLGRTRPSSRQVDAFHGPNLNHEFQSCPSGHTTTAFGAALPLLIAAPPLGAATTVVAVSVGWSRMYLSQHYPSDVALGIWMALWFAVPLGYAARVRRISDEPVTRRPV